MFNHGGNWRFISYWWTKYSEIQIVGEQTCYLYISRSNSINMDIDDCNDIRTTGYGNF